mmetsp:Transcript_28650/g.66037  ORF Transcript_28650/g.66037 Transcript_28650/m.66037 type:complete len:296 (+) Transcript_28650:63-950(+)
MVARVTRGSSRRGRLSVVLPALVALTCALKHCGLFLTPVANERLQRRDAVLASASAVLGWSAVSDAASAEDPKPPGYYDPAWQLRLPRDWATFSTSEVPEDGAPVAVAQAGNMEQETSVSVLRVPLYLVNDTSYEAKAKLIDYFKTPLDQTPSEPATTIANILSDSFQIEAGNVVRFEVVAPPTATIQNGRRYFTFGYESTQCYGQLVEGTKDLFCQDPKGGELPFIDRTHSLKCTVDLQGQPDKDVLWLVDLSTPTQDWKALQGNAEETLKSFELGTTEGLQKGREAFFGVGTK